MFLLVCVCLWAVCFSLLLRASADIGNLSEKSAPDSVCVCVCVCDSGGRIRRYKKTSKHLLGSIKPGGRMKIQLVLVPLSPCSLLTILKQS